MGVTSGGSQRGIGADWEVGTIVWVRRRNGSWWPGRIMGQHELSASHLLSPRSGTPVKLLGREDASVDWYNLEKSKRVKVFRCGEFSSCIERAVASQGFPIKKREKYARREDAILHALELEKQMLEQRHKRMGKNPSNKLYGMANKDQSACFFETINTMSVDEPMFGELINHRKVDLPFLLTSKRKRLPNKRKGYMLSDHKDSSFDVVALASQKKGLEDPSFPVVSSKRKLGSPRSYGSLKRPLPLDSIMHSAPSIQEVDAQNNHGGDKSCLDLEGISLIEPNENSIKKKWGNRQPLQVLQSPAEFPSPESMPPWGHLSDLLPSWSLHFENHGHLEKENLTTGFHDSDLSERLHVDSDMEHEEVVLSSFRQTSFPQVTAGRKGACNDWTLHSQRLFVTIGKDATLLSGQRTDSLAEAGVSRWRLKGKRNTRRVSSKTFNSVSEKCDYNVARNAAATGFESKPDDSSGSLIKKDQVSAFCLTDDVSYRSAFQGDSMDSLENIFNNAHRESRDMSLSGWDIERVVNGPQKGQSDAPSYLGHLISDSFSEKLDSRLVKVDLKVQTSYRGEHAKHAPLVSLTSTLNGKVIIGHPLEIETLSDGFTTSLLLEVDHGQNPSSSVGITGPHIWRTARRTAMSHPRSHAASCVFEDGALGIPQASGRVCEVPIGFVKKDFLKYGLNKKLQKRSSKKQNHPYHRARTVPSPSKSQNKSGSSSDGIELSSKVDTLGKLIEPGHGLPVVSCVPVKVVFSRILEMVLICMMKFTCSGHLTTEGGNIGVYLRVRFRIAGIFGLDLAVVEYFYHMLPQPMSPDRANSPWASLWHRL